MMDKKQRAVELLERIPEEKMDYILGVLEGAAIQPVNMENIQAFLGNDDEDDMEELCNALESFARAEMRMYKKK